MRILDVGNIGWSEISEIYRLIGVVQERSVIVTVLHTNNVVIHFNEIWFVGNFEVMEISDGGCLIVRWGNLGGWEHFSYKLHITNNNIKIVTIYITIGDGEHSEISDKNHPIIFEARLVCE